MTPRGVVEHVRQREVSTKMGAGHQCLSCSISELPNGVYSILGCCLCGTFLTALGGNEAKAVDALKHKFLRHKNFY